MAHEIFSIKAPEDAWHGVVFPGPKPIRMVACERGDGALNVHPENATCDICSPTIREDEK